MYGNTRLSCIKCIIYDSKRCWDWVGELDLCC